MSIIYFHVAMALVNAEEVGCSYYHVALGDGEWQKINWVRRTKVLTFCANRLYRKLGQY